MSEARISVSEPGLARVSGELSFSSVTSLLGESLFEESGRDWTIDLDEVEKADSAALALLIEWLRRAKSANCTLRFANIPEQLQLIIDVSDLQDLLSDD